MKRRLNPIDAAGWEKDQVMTAGILDPIKKAHNPITYIVLALLAGFKWNWCFRNPYYWFAVGFCIKWYRARYVFKIPVWDRQPNWNNIITSKEQEKDLKAYTCKKCGSTIFIAKTREFFFEGNTGIGGLGCFSCGAKGKENFVMDRDRIVEDVADMDDYFEYERPLDFVSRAERRKVMKEAGGDEDKANQILLDRAAAAAAATATTTGVVDDANESESELSVEYEVTQSEQINNTQNVASMPENDIPSTSHTETNGESPSDVDTDYVGKIEKHVPEQPIVTNSIKETQGSKQPSTGNTKKAPSSTASDSDLDILEMDM